MDTPTNPPEPLAELAPAPLLEQLLAVARESALEEMARGISQELHQPLGAILTYAQAGERMLARPGASLDTAREVLQLIAKEALAAAASVRRMRSPFQPAAAGASACAMGDVVRELGNLLAARAAAAQVALSIHIDALLPDVRIHRLRVQYVLFTLTQNAIDAALSRPSSAPEVAVSVCGDRYGVETAVADNGHGIAQAHRTQIFRPFFTTKPRGSGLGLSSARAIIESHGGTMGFEPHGRQGSRFWFRLPTSHAA